ncbi:response regulator [Halobacteriovorax sp. HLS]|uniref:response regulator n=1 Tax=Halobacteriovorax sp. HLS TaxID=2234000 RepID=UPI000FD8B45A|nr:response regulator [Halobacteriovorax sp. HLS]
MNNDQEKILLSFAESFSLTPREGEIVGQLLLQMTSTKQISDSLGISTSTVRNHFESIFRKTGCENKCEVAVLLYKQLLTKVQDFKPFGRSPKVIVVDDNEVMCELLATSLEPYGINITAVTESEKVLELLEVDRYDCIISDIRMPSMDGVELLERIRKTHPIWPFVILISGHHDYDMDDLLNHGAVAFVQKPFKVDELYSLISAYYIDDLVERNRAMLMDKDVLYDFSENTIDLSQVSVGAGGIFISFDNSPELRSSVVGNVYDFSLKVSDQINAVQVAAEIVWKKEENIDTPGVGIRFLTMTPQIDSYIKKHISKNKIQSFIPNN